MNPKPPMSNHTIARRVQFYETDVAGIVHFSWFFRYMEEAEHALWREAGLSIHPPNAEVGWPRISASCEFHRPLAFEDQFEVTIRITEITRRTMSYACVVTQAGRTIASGVLRIACVRKGGGEGMRSIDIPQEIADRFEVARTLDSGTRTS
jgi:acyl-CoA thioester hydrolase